MDDIQKFIQRNYIRDSRCDNNLFHFNVSSNKHILLSYVATYEKNKIVYDSIFHHLPFAKKSFTRYYENMNGEYELRVENPKYEIPMTFLVMNDIRRINIDENGIASFHLFQILNPYR